MRLTTKIALVLFSVGLIASITGSLFVHRCVTAELQQSVGENDAVIARVAMDEIDRSLEGAYQDIQAISHEPLFVEFLTRDTVGNPSDVQRRLRYLMRHSGPWNALLFIDQDGVVRASNVDELVGATVEQDPECERAFESAADGQVYYSDLVFSQRTGELTVIFATPIVNHTDPRRPVVGAVVGHFVWRVVSEILRDVEGPRLTLYNAEGIVIATSDPEDELLILQQNDREHPVVQYALSGDSQPSVLPGTHDDGATLVAHARQLGHAVFRGKEWVLVAETPMMRALAEARKVATNLALLMGVIILVGFGATMLLLYRQISQPLTRLTTVANEIAGGDLSKRAQEQSRDEVGQLAHAFNEMTDELTKLTAELEQRVADRTEEVGQRAEELERSNTQLEDAIAALERSNLELQQFAYSASHDLQEPLRSVAGFCQLLQRRYKGQLDAQADEWIHFTVQSAARMRALIEDLLIYSRVESQVIPFEPIDCSEVFDDAVTILKGSIKESGADVTRDELPSVMGLRSQLVQLMQNLIGNGIKFRGEAPPQVRVSAVRKADQWVLAVRDNGIGVPAAQAESIFGLFRRLHTEQTYPGTGVGLAICRRVVERHQGTIWVESDAATGSTFYFTFPAAITNTEF